MARTQVSLGQSAGVSHSWAFFPDKLLFIAKGASKLALTAQVACHPCTSPPVPQLPRVNIPDEAPEEASHHFYKHLPSPVSNMFKGRLWKVELGKRIRVSPLPFPSHSGETPSLNV